MSEEIRGQTKGFILCEQAETEPELLSGHVEPCRGIPHTHPATVTCDSQSSSTGQQIKTQQPPFLHPWGEWNRNAERRERKKADKRGRTCFVISPGDGFTLVRSRSLPFSFTSSLLHPPLLSEAVTPARCTSLTPHAAFLSSPEKSLVKWQWTKSCWLAPGSGGERKSGEGKGISGLMPTSGHSSVNCCTAQCSSAQHCTEPWIETRIWVGLLHCCGSPLEWYS